MKYHLRLAIVLAITLPAFLLILMSRCEIGAADEPAQGSKLQFSTQEAWEAFPGNRPGISDIFKKLERIADLNANRELSSGDRKNILALSDYLIDKRYGWVPRSSAADDLGRYGHSFAIPALLAVIRDESDHTEVRKHAVIALGRIRNKRNVMYLVEDGLGSGERALAFAAWETLARSLSDIPNELKDSPYTYFQPPPGLIPLPGAEEVEPYGTNQERLEEYLEIWREWWRKDHENVTLSRPLGIR